MGAVVRVQERGCRMVPVAVSIVNEVSLQNSHMPSSVVGHGRAVRRSTGWRLVSHIGNFAPTEHTVSLPLELLNTFACSDRFELESLCPEVVIMLA